MGERNINMFFAMIIIMFILFLSLISIIFDLTGLFFIFELLLLLLSISFGVLLTFRIYKRDEGVWSGLLVFFGANLINLSFLFWKAAGFSAIILPLTVGIAGFVITLIEKEPKKEDNWDTSNNTVAEEPIEEKKIEHNVEDIKVNFSPGKYVASETGKKYHIPRCDWAKKISQNNIVWLDDKADAKKRGYEPCRCV